MSVAGINENSVIVACERSAKVRDALRARGVDAWSCDIEETLGDPRWHIVGDAVSVVYGFPWAALIAHPPCTDTAVSGAHRFALKIASGRQQMSLGFVRALWLAPVPLKALEQPVSISGRVIGRAADIVVQPYWFGHDASKKTCFWLDGLPKLKPTQFVSGRMVEWPVGSGRMVERWANQTDAGQNRLPPSKHRAALRSETYDGIAAAIGDQWAPFLPRALA